MNIYLYFNFWDVKGVSPQSIKLLDLEQRNNQTQYQPFHQMMTTLNKRSQSLMILSCTYFFQLNSTIMIILPITTAKCVKRGLNWSGGGLCRKHIKKKSLRRSILNKMNCFNQPPHMKKKKHQPPQISLLTETI